jgi:hypothetical protein
MDWGQTVSVVIGAAVALAGTVALDQSRRRRERHAELCGVYDRVVQLFEADYLTASEPVGAAKAMQAWDNRASQAVSVLAIHGASPDVKTLAGDYRVAVIQWSRSAWSQEGRLNVNAVMAGLHRAMERHLGTVRRGRLGRLGKRPPSA